MKKLALCLILSLVMCLAMAFPVSAATNGASYTYDIMRLYSIVDDYAVSVIPSDYKYKIVLLYGGMSTIFNFDNVTVLYFNVSDVSFNSNIQYYCISAKMDGTIADLGVQTYRYVGTVNDYLFGLYYTKNTVNYSTRFFYYVPLLSSANLTGLNTINPNNDYAISIINIVTLQSLISTAKSKTNTGYTNTSWQGLQSAITAAENLLKTTGYTQSQVDSEKNKLQVALDGLQLLTDTSALQSLISTAKSKTNTGYTNTSWQALQSAITDAESFLATTGYTQSQVDSAKDSLQAALDGLELLPDTMELEELLVEADQIEDIGYTVPTWTRFDNARTAGHTLLAQPVYTQPEVEETSTELRVSMNGLILQAVTPPPAPLGFDLGSGNISGFLAPAYPMFADYVITLRPVLIGFFAIIFSIKLIPIAFERIFGGFKR